MLSSKQIIRNINLHLLTDMELDNDIQKMLDDLNIIFKDLNIYKSDRYKDIHLTYYGYKKEDLFIMYDSYLNYLSVSTLLCHNIFLKYNKSEAIILLDLIKHYINIFNLDENINCVIIDSSTSYNSTPISNLYKIGTFKKINDV